MPRKVVVLNIGLLLLASAVSIFALAYGSAAAAVMGLASVAVLCASLALEVQIS